MDKLKEIFNFLKENHQYNQKLQIEFALSSVGHKENEFDKLVVLLYDTFNTQSQPKIDKISNFMKDIYANNMHLNSFTDFYNLIVDKEDNSKGIYHNLFINLQSKNGWGPKTSALLIKNIYNYHNTYNEKKLIIWKDVPKLDKDDKIYLPVDAVILSIFNELYPKSNTFTNINKKFHALDSHKVRVFDNNDILMFDDLWFWGFITQEIVKNKLTNKSERKHVWNENKYWAMKESSKDEKIKEEIQVKAELFLEILNKNAAK